ncbi:MAG: XrtA/PEP-CTERM system histidine kinase PrsK [Sphingopyxis sp.]
MSENDLINTSGVAAALLAAIGFAVMAIKLWMRGSPFGRAPYATALTMMTLWLLLCGLLGGATLATWIVETARNLSWLWFMAAIAGTRERGRWPSAIGWIYIGLFAIEAVLGAVLVGATLSNSPVRYVAHSVNTVQMLFSAGALVLVHNLTDAARPDERRALSLPMAAIALMWGYDFNLYAISYLSGEPARLLMDLRPFTTLVVAALLAIMAMRPAGQAVRLSRPAAFRSLALAGVASWMATLSLLAVLMSNSGGDFSGRAQGGVVAACLVSTCLLFLSPKLRARARVWTAKHFFEHRYDYRAEWLRFTATLNRPEAGGLSLPARVVKAIGDIVESGSGVLIVPDAAGRLALASAWPAGALGVTNDADWGEFATMIGTEDRIVQFDEVRAGKALAHEMAAIPAWMRADRALWIAVPLVHLERVEGVVLLARAPIDRALDWEDFDLLKVAGRQAASHLAQARGAEALSESARFEEFHRRFAFMMHDVKNLASQMALLSRNVERHGDNPDFREDMVATLRLSADRLAQMMQRLSQQERVRIDTLAPVDIGMVATRIAGIKRAAHRVEVTGTAPARARGDYDTVEQLLSHLVQNAIDASPADRPVTLRLGGDAGHVVVSVEDHGVGMSPEFIRSDLFRPFSSTKDGGFGIGAYQARQLAQAMGGALSVESREGEGSRFTLTLPSIAPRTSGPPLPAIGPAAHSIQPIPTISTIPTIQTRSDAA